MKEQIRGPFRELFRAVVKSLSHRDEVVSKHAQHLIRIQDCWTSMPSLEASIHCVIAEEQISGAL